jgi:hypothetical protein
MIITTLTIPQEAMILTILQGYTWWNVRKIHKVKILYETPSVRQTTS